MTNIKQKTDIADKRAEVLKNIHELKRHTLPHLHTNYLDARKYLTSIVTYKNGFTALDIIMFRYRYKKLKATYLFTIELYHSLRAYLKTLT